ncbi:hypothetical protein BKA58DRAFT_26180 [Alternaria rosae]|uniref:uncharacterized protein n=1 Tax=Alternaria rosae TaxID=1187941 RepID=UPI001E8EE0EF|nr:uncharacterized protein BKA58DRAFT_26180 [Alternaria rosae]KAH6882873.1 hypothetical protein BKA58DRAFT_26180 [Alternaria rosae]
MPLHEDAMCIEGGLVIYWRWQRRAKGHQVTTALFGRLYTALAQSRTNHASCTILNIYCGYPTLGKGSISSTCHYNSQFPAPARARTAIRLPLNCKMLRALSRACPDLSGCSSLVMVPGRQVGLVHILWLFCLATCHTLHPGLVALGYRARRPRPQHGNYTIFPPLRRASFRISDRGNVRSPTSR